MKYSEKLRDPRWQKKRLEILERDERKCQSCFDYTSTLAVHHRIYIKGKEPWDYPNEHLVTLCENCHAQEMEERSECEQSLLEELRKHYFALDIYQISQGLFDGGLKPLIDQYLKDAWEETGRRARGLNVTTS